MKRFEIIDWFLDKGNSHSDYFEENRIDCEDWKEYALPGVDVCPCHAFDLVEGVEDGWGGYIDGCEVEGVTCDECKYSHYFVKFLDSFLKGNYKKRYYRVSSIAKFLVICANWGKVD